MRFRRRRRFAPREALYSKQFILVDTTAMKSDTAIWYVSFALRKPDVAHHRFARQTRTFTNEQEAKAFARTLLVQTQDVCAGTINPHSPRRVIAPAAITTWVGES